MSLAQAPSVSSGAGSPETYHGHSGSIPHQKNTYRHIPGHQPVAGAAGYSPALQNNAGSPYHPQLGVQNGQYYQPIPGQGAGFMPMYGSAPGSHVDGSGYYYYGPNSWAMHGPMPVYNPHSFTGSPPTTPSQVQMPYGGYPLMQAAHEFLPAPSIHITGASGQATGHNVPRHDHRRNSWSSSGATDTPITPYPVNVNPSTNIMGEGLDMNGAGTCSDQRDELGKYVERLLLSGPRVPSPIPGAFMTGTIKTMSEALANPTNTTNVYIRGLPPDTDDDKLYEMTCRFGNVISHKAIMDTEHGTCKGYGFARYETTDEAENCIRGLVSLKYEAGFARESFNARLKTLADPNSTNIYVSNLPRDMNEKDMQDIFEGYIVVSNRILRDSQGQSRGVGFARFESREICNQIIRNFHGYPVGRERIALQVRYADTSAQKRLKATTTKKRQFRANEYNNLVSGNYSQEMESVHQHIHPSNPIGQSTFGTRPWPRHNNSNAINPNMMGDMPSQQAQQQKSGPRKWDKSQDWVGHGEENRHTDWKANPARWMSSGSSDQHVKLETVHENPDDNISETQSELTTIPHLGRSTSSLGKGSSGSFSDPGDSYGGREYSAVSE